jgi:hypothetical protein
VNVGERRERETEDALVGPALHFMWGSQTRCRLPLFRDMGVDSRPLTIKATMIFEHVTCHWCVERHARGRRKKP